MTLQLIIGQLRSDWAVEKSGAAVAANIMNDLESLGRVVRQN